jgi:hypothetical protein
VQQFFVVEKQWMLHIVSVYVALGTQHAICMRRIVIFACPALHNFFRFISYSAWFSKKLQNIKCVVRFSLQIWLKLFFILRRIERDTIKNVHSSFRKVPVILVRFKLNLNFLKIFEKYSNVLFLLFYRASWQHQDPFTNKCNLLLNT